MDLLHFLYDTSRKFPHKEAVICDSKRITYRNLKFRVEKLASALYSLGVKKSTPAGILCLNCIEYIEIIFALLKLGAVCVPLNYRLMPHEIRTLVEHAGLTLLFYEKETEGRVPFDSPLIKTFITIGSEPNHPTISYESLFASKTCKNHFEPVSEHDESFIIYTAGTTGSSKGVVLTHGNQIWNTLNYTAAYGLNPHDKELAPTPLFHTSTLGRVFTYVFNAVSFVLCRKFNPKTCLDIIQKERITSITQTPTMYNRMLTAFKKGLWNTRSIRRAVTGASTMTTTMKMQLSELFPMARFFDLYGLTEAGPGVTILHPADFSRKLDSVGKPMLTVEVVIKNEQGDIVPSGQIGEILCRGPNIMKGYYKDPVATAEVLKNGWLNTGDMGQMDDEGFLYIVGRKKDIIISGGINIYPGEVEKVLMEHPLIDDVSVIGIPDETWGERVVAVVVLKPDKHCTEESIQDFCKNRLAGFKCPRSVFLVNELPRNAAQKVVKKELQRRYKKIGSAFKTKLC